jgi:hypothetical protein
MLARYAAERLSVGLPPVVPLDDYRAPIPEGYDPGLILKSDGTVLRPARRPQNASLNDIQVPEFNDRPGAKIAAQELFRDRILVAVSAPETGNRPSTLAMLSELVEPTDRYATSYFGALHNDGHLLIAFHDNDPHNKGVMFWEETAIRDPVFYRWHTQIDDIFQRYKDGLDPYDFSDSPQVEASSLTVVSESGNTNSIQTQMRKRKLSYPDSTSTTIDYLSHDGFACSVLADNDSVADIQVTVRIFMAPEENLEDRRAWIEMDKFRHVLPAKSTTNILRSSKESSVIRHPVLTASILEGDEAWPVELGLSPGCKCGWPYTLLLPRGRQGGMAFRFVAILSPGDDIITDALDSANSASYCGVRDSRYPDKRAMGYPFDRPFKTSISDWIEGDVKPRQLASSVVNILHV